MLNMLLTGGSKGADLLWHQLAKNLGHDVMAFSFVNHSFACNREDLVVLNELELSEGDSLIAEANTYLKRNYPSSSSYVNNLIRRNYWQVKGSKRIYATQELDEDTGLVMGGTGFTVTMGILLGIPEIWLFEPKQNQWLRYHGNTIPSGDWRSITGNPPKPHGIYTGIGAHDLQMNSYIAIKDLMDG